MKQLTTKERKQCILLLQAARIRLGLQRDDMICFALEASNARGTAKMIQYLVDWVDAMLDGSNSYSGWMAEHHGDLYFYTSQLERRQRLRQGRIAWLDWMVRELEAGK